MTHDLPTTLPAPNPHPGPLPEYRARGPETAYFIALVLIGVAAIIVTLFATRWGISTSSDSARYIRSARHVLGREVRVEQEVSAEAKAEQAHYPPMYSAVLALVSLGGADPLNAARWLHAFLLAANAVIAAELVRRFTGSAAAALFTAVASAFSYASIFIHTIALSEPLYVFFGLLALGLLAAHLRRPRWRLLVASALLCGAGVLTRYAGWAMVPAGAACLLLLPPGRAWRRRSIPWRSFDAMAFVAIACVLPFAWSIRNQIVLGSATNRVLAWHPVTLTHLRDGARTAWNWLAADRVIHPALTGLAAIVAAAVFVLPILWNVRRGAADGDSAGGAGGAGGAPDDARHALTLPAVMLIFSLAFTALLVVSISLFDFHTPVDARILSPVYAAWLIVVGCVLAEANRRSEATWAAAWTIAVMLAVWSIGRGGRLAHDQFRDGAGFAHRQWRESETLAALARLVPREQMVYTNAPGAMYLLTGRPAIVTLPSKSSASSTRENPKYPDQLRRMGEDVQSGHAVVVYLRRYRRGRQTSHPSEQELRGPLGMHVLARGNDGAVYVAGAGDAVDGNAAGGRTTSTTAPATAPNAGIPIPPEALPTTDYAGDSPPPSSSPPDADLD